MVQPLENDICYANLTLTQTGTFPSSSRKETFTRSHPSAQVDQEAVEYVSMVCTRWGPEPDLHRGGWVLGKVAAIKRPVC